MIGLGRELRHIIDDIEAAFLGYIAEDALGGRSLRFCLRSGCPEAVSQGVQHMVFAIFAVDLQSFERVGNA
jgi:hypothetical protein